MIIYSESFHVEHSIEIVWREWVKNILIPEIHKTAIFFKVVFSKVISHVDETGSTYSLQYYISDKKSLENFYKNHSEKIYQLLFNKFGTQILSFKTELELIESFEF